MNSDNKLSKDIRKTDDSNILSRGLEKRQK